MIVNFLKLKSLQCLLQLGICTLTITWLVGYLQLCLKLDAIKKIINEKLFYFQ